VSAAENGGLPIENFIQALTSQLDRAQSTMALKARAGLPLTFAVKDLTLDLRTHVEMVGAAVRIRPAEPGETEASTLHLSLTTITRPMIEENTLELQAKPDEPSLREVLGGEVTEDEQRRLEWAGVYTTSQLRDLERHAGTDAIQRVSQLPVDRLRRALQLASEPAITRVVPELPHDYAPANGRPSGADEPLPVLRVRGRNLFESGPPRVTIEGEHVPVLSASADEILVRPEAHQLAGTLSVETEPGTVVEVPFDARPESERRGEP
jgi:hypothetical protein